MKLETRRLTREQIEANPEPHASEGWAGDETLEVICDGEVLCYLKLPMKKLRSWKSEYGTDSFGLNFVTGGHYI
tara:strand:+ start:397 stop:618 length:222 start_codon:yes stop_codon:yes gene_type:complete